MEAAFIFKAAALMILGYQTCKYALHTNWTIALLWESDYDIIAVVNLYSLKEAPVQHLHKIMRLTTRDIVEVKLTAPAYVFLMDEDNYENYLDDKEFEYYGELVKNSTIQLRAPFLDQWHLVIEQENKADDLQVAIRIVS